MMFDHTGPGKGVDSFEERGLLRSIVDFANRQRTRKLGKCP
jgi:hypothetical protein